MKLEAFSYLITILVFAGTMVATQWVLHFKKLKKYSKLIGILIVIFLAFTAVADPLALRWRAWYYSPGKFLGVYLFGAPLESYIYAIFVTIAIASSTLIGSEPEK